MSDRVLAKLTLPTDESLLPPAVGFVREVATHAGLEDSEGLGHAVETVCGNVIRYAFDPGHEGRYDIEVIRRPGQVVVAVEDLGLPFDYTRLQHDEEKDPPDSLGHAFSDEVRFINLGRGGNRVEMIRNLDPSDLEEEARNESASQEPVPEYIEPEIRAMRPDEVTELSRAIYRSYGYTYDADFVYYPERVREMLQSGRMYSFVAVGQDGELVGHLASILPYPGSKVAESGQAVVDPRYRGHKLFEKMKTYMLDQTRLLGWYGLYGEATAIHPYSQLGVLKVGGRETGFCLGYIPANVAYASIDEERAGRRGSIALMYTRLNEAPHREIYPPPEYAEIVHAINERSALDRSEGKDSSPTLQAETQLQVEVRRDHNFAFVKVDEYGEDLEEKLRLHLRELCLRKVDVIYLDLPLSHPFTREVGRVTDSLGFFFSAIVPELRPDGDVLRFQYLNEVEILPEDIKTASDFGQNLLEFILARKAAAEV